MPKQFGATNFPETLFAVEEDDGEGGTFIVASEDASDFAVLGEATIAAEYRLVRAGVVVSTAVVVE